MARKFTRLFLEENFFKAQKFFLSSEHSHYLLRVLRLKKNDSLYVFNASQGEWLAVIIEDLKKQVIIEIQEQKKKPQIDFLLTLIFAPLKPRAMDILIEKSTELGVTTFQPVWSDRTQGRDFNLKRYKSLSYEASEQSERLTVPEFRSPLTFHQLLEHRPSKDIIFVGDERRQSASFFSLLKESQPEIFTNSSTIPSMTVMIGPEGGFTDPEFDFLQRQNFCRLISLGPTILKAETACLYALSLAQAKMFSQSQER